MAALTMTMTTGTAPATASLLPSVGTPSVPILGQVALKSNYETGKTAGVGTLHGVRRIPGGTVVYFSVGYPASTPEDSAFLGGLDHDSPGFSRVSDVTSFAKNMVVDPAGKKVYSGLVRSGDPSRRAECVCSDVAGYGGYRSGQARVLYQVVAPLPATVAFVDGFISGQGIGHVKVEDGPRTHEVDASKRIPAAMAWPGAEERARGPAGGRRRAVRGARIDGGRIRGGCGLYRAATRPAMGARKGCGPSCSAMVMPMAPASCSVGWSNTSQSWAVRCIQVPMLETSAPMNQIR